MHVKGISIAKIILSGEQEEILVSPPPPHTHTHNNKQNKSEVKMCEFEDTLLWSVCQL